MPHCGNQDFNISRLGGDALLSFGCVVAARVPEIFGRSCRALASGQTYVVRGVAPVDDIKQACQPSLSKDGIPPSTIAAEKWWQPGPESEASKQDETRSDNRIPRQRPYTLEASPNWLPFASSMTGALFNRNQPSRWHYGTLAQLRRCRALDRTILCFLS